MNPGFDQTEIEKLRAECEEEGRSFVFVESEFDDQDDIDEHAHVQFIGTYEGKDVIYDALIYTLRLHHSALVYDRALERLQKQFPGYLPPDEREPGKQYDQEADEEAELVLTELIEEIEENEEVKVQEHIEVDPEFDYGIGLEVGLNVDAIDDQIVEDFIRKFNSNQLVLDKAVYSFRSEEEEE